MASPQGPGARGRWAPAGQGLIGNTCDCEVGFAVIELQIRRRLRGVSDGMSRISVRGRVTALRVGGRRVWGFPKRGALQGWLVRDLILCKERSPGKCCMGPAGDPHRGIWDCLGVAVNCKPTCFTKKSTPSSLRLSSQAGLFHSRPLCAPADCPLQLVRMKRHFP